MRIVALSDQHGYLPNVPPCDLLIVGGDVCPDRIHGELAEDNPALQKSWFDAHVRPWLAEAPAVHKVLTWGNHDWCGQACDFASDFPGRACSTALQILVDAGTRVPAADATGRSVSVWASPWSNQFMHWAFMKTRPDLAHVYAAIPGAIDILVSHQPPLGYGDRHHPPGVEEGEHLGNADLLAAIDRIRPRLVICGHIHGGHGRFDYNGTSIYNVSVVDDSYQLVRPATIIDVPAW